MLKNIIIGGTVRSGKTTLANKLRDKFLYSKVESDTIVNAFDKVFPELGITHKKPDLAREKYEPFLFEVLNGFCRDLKYGGNVTIFPGAQFLPENLNNYEKKEKFIIIFLGFDGVTADELLMAIRENDTPSDWTYSKTDEWLYRFCQNIINESEKIKIDCEKYGFYYFNSFCNRDSVFEEICSVVQKLQDI